MTEMQQPVDERWDHAKASMMAAVLIEHTTFPELTANSAIRLEAMRESKHAGVIEANERLDAHTELLRDGDLEGWSLRLKVLRLQSELAEVQASIQMTEAERTRTANLVRSSDVLLASYSELYDSNPTRFDAMSVDEFIELIDEVEDLEATVKRCREAIPILVVPINDLREVQSVKGVMSSWTAKKVANQVSEALRLVHGKNSDFPDEAQQQYDSIIADSYTSLSPKGFVSLILNKTEGWLAHIRSTSEQSLRRMDDLLKLDSESSKSDAVADDIGRS